MTTLIADETPVARISHGCNVCLGRIGVGDKYHRQRVADCGDIWVFKCHSICWAIETEIRRQWQLIEEDSTDPGEVGDMLRGIFTALTGRSQT